MKLEESESFLIVWPEGQVHLNTISEAMGLLGKGAPGCARVSVQCQAYLAFREPPPAWMALFEGAPTGSFRLETRYTRRLETGGELTVCYHIAPCEHGEHLHAVVLAEFNAFGQGEVLLQSPASADLIYRGWQQAADELEALKSTWVHPFLEEALEIEGLHGGVS